MNDDRPQSLSEISHTAPNGDSVASVWERGNERDE